MPTDESSLTVAVTGPTGTFGHGLMPLLQDEPSVAKVVGIARRSFDPVAEGWTKMEYRRGDVRDEDALRQAFTGADVVVHLAFLIIGGENDTTRSINIEGTLNAFRAAAAAGAKRFVYASSVAAYGFHRDNPVGMTEEWPTRPAEKLFYAQEKAELEELLEAESAKHPELELYLLRPPVVLGPHTVGGKAPLPGPLAPLNKYLQGAIRRLPLPVPALVPDIPIQFIHEDDVGRALLQCVIAAGPPGAYNIAGEGVLSLLEVAREFNVVPIPISSRAVYGGARLLSRLPLRTAGEWIEAFSHPAIMDTTRASEQLGWKPQYTGLEALRDTLQH